MLLHLTRKERDNEYDLNQLRTEPWMPNQDERWVSKMLWSMVSKAAESPQLREINTIGGVNGVSKARYALPVFMGRDNGP